MRSFRFTPLILILLVACSDEVSQIGPFVTPPNRPDGPAKLPLYVVGVFTAGGAAGWDSGPLEYRFDLDRGGAHDSTEWSTQPTARKFWMVEGNYSVAAQARMLKTPSVVSDWSRSREVVVSENSNTGTPRVAFTLHSDGQSWPCVPGVTDTVGALVPFQISYRGLSAIAIEAYRYYPAVVGFNIRGANVWTANLWDTVRAFGGFPDRLIGVGAQCRDAAGGRSDSLLSCVVRVNFDPDVRITGAVARYNYDGIWTEEVVDLTDGIPDTVGYQAWLTLHYSGWDDRRDMWPCGGSDPDGCVDFQARFIGSGPDGSGYHEDTGWLPRPPLTQETNPNEKADSNSFNIGTVGYDFLVRTIDGYGRSDGTPDQIRIEGNFSPTLDGVTMEDHLGNQLNLSEHDTLSWNFWKGEGWPYTSAMDTIQISGANVWLKKTFYWVIKARGHDDPRDRGGIEAWRYRVDDAGGSPIRLGHSSTWIGAEPADALCDTFRVTILYPIDDSLGATVTPPSYLNQSYSVELWGRDLPAFEQFTQYGIFNSNITLINQYFAGGLARTTNKQRWNFHFRWTH